MSKVPPHALIWKPFRDEWVLFRDEELVVVDKPEGIPTQSPDAELPDDLPYRLGQHLACEPPRIIHRLDQETSGVVALALSRAAASAVSAQFAARSVTKTYWACVRGYRGGHRRLSHRLAPDEAGRMVPVSVHDPRGKVAESELLVRERMGDRTLLELTLHSGRTHQARAQLAAIGYPIVGDALYGGDSFPRLLLHASRLEFTHPAGEPLVLEAAQPPDFSLWLRCGHDPNRVYGEDPAPLARRIATAFERRYGLAQSAHSAHPTDAFRVINDAGDGLPGLAVDYYRGYLVAQLYDGPGTVWQDAAVVDRVLDGLAHTGAKGVYLKRRPKQANTLVETRREDLAPAKAVRGESAPDELVVHEWGTPFGVKLGDGLSTGIFLDQRGNRRLVQSLSQGLSVLNLFAYTCAFSVSAARGGARETVSVDASWAALARGQQNLARVGADGARHSVVVDDAARYLASAARKGLRFDLILLDPPSYSSTKKGRFVAKDDYASLAAACLALLEDGGRLLSCCNLRTLSPASFRKVLFDAGRLANRSLASVRDLPTGRDFPSTEGGPSGMKSLMVTLGPAPVRPATGSRLPHPQRQRGGPRRPNWPPRKVPR